MPPILKNSVINKVFNSVWAYNRAWHSGKFSKCELRLIIIVAIRSVS